MMFQTLERLTELELRQLRHEAYRHALMRKAPRRGGQRLATWLRWLADRFEGRRVTGVGPWLEDFEAARIAHGRVRVVGGDIGGTHA